MFHKDTGQEAKSALTWQRRKFSDRRRHQSRRNHGASRRAAAREAGTGRRASVAQWSDGNQGDNADEEGRRADVGFPHRAAVARAGKFWADVGVTQRVPSARASAADAGHQEKVLHVDMGFFQNAMLGKKSHVDMGKSHVNMGF